MAWANATDAECAAFDTCYDCRAVRLSSPHSPSQTGANALMACGEKETAVRPGHVLSKR
jgi:hypothetical protein